MNLKDINKKYMVGFVAIALISLIIVTLMQPGQLKFVDKTDYGQLEAKAEFERGEYKKILAEVEPDYEASREFMEEVITEDMVREEFDRALNLDQKVVYPEIRNSDLKISNRKDQDSVANYLTTVSSMAINLNSDLTPLMPQMFSTASPESALEAKQKSQQVLDNLKDVSVPVDAVAMQKSILVSYQKQVEFFDTAAKYAQDSESTPWNRVYEQYLTVDQSAASVKKQIEFLNKTYALENLQVPVPANGLIKTAQAGWPVIDVWEVVHWAWRYALSQAFAAFYLKMSNNIIQHIEKTFAIASQLYYSNALDRHYSLEYLEKFVTDPIDKTIIKQFLPKTFCEPKDDEKIKQIFKAKAKQAQGNYLTIDPSNPDFLLNNGTLSQIQEVDKFWWDDYFSVYSGEVAADAKKSAGLEVLSDGIKNGKSVVDNFTVTTMQRIKDAQQSFLKSILDLGANQPDNVISQLIASFIKTFVDNNVFTPLGPGKTYVYKEQKTCNRLPLINPVSPVPNAPYTPPFQPVYPPTVPLPTR